MGQIFAEAERELDGVLRRYAGRPRAAVEKLLLMSLEREQIVSMAYREAAIAARLARMPLDDATRRVIGHAVIWIWKDEEIHAVYARAALARLAGGHVKLKVLAQQAGGAVAGWATSVIQHSPWRTSPVAGSAARLVTGMGRLAGKVPAEVGRLLRHCSFADFCRFNSELERASELSWDRLTRVAGTLPDFEPETLVAFWRVAEDERKHREVFDAFADALTPDDRLAPGASAEALADAVRAVGSHWLPRAWRGGTPNPIGGGGRVYCHASPQQGDRRAAFRAALAECDLADVVRARAAELGKPLADMSVAVKACFMLGYHRADPSPYTAPELVEELALFLRGLGVGDVAACEVRNLYDRFFAGRDVAAVARYLGYGSPHYRLVDLTEDAEPHAYRRGVGSAVVGRAWRRADVRISFGKLRSHPVDQALLTLANLEGVGGRHDQFLFAEREADRAAALMMLLDDFPPHYALLDAFADVPDGMIGMIGCSRPRSPGRFYAGADALAVDGVVGRHLGWPRPEASGFLSAAAHWFGGWPAGVTVVGCDAPLRPWAGPQSGDLRALLSLMALPVYVWGSGRGSLFVPEMDPAAFPPLGTPSRSLCQVRALVRRVLGLRLKRP